MSFGFLPARTSDGRMIVLPSTIRDDQEVQYTGCGDDLDNGIRMAGADFKMHYDAAGDYDVTFRFIEWVDILGGVCQFSGANYGDYMHYAVSAPATVGEENEGAGGYIKYPVGDGMNIYIPHPTAEGDWDLDLEETINENVSVTKVVPIPDATKQGFFDWDSNTGLVTINETMAGGYNLFDFAIPLGRMINKCWILGTGEENYLVPASYSAKRILPHWVHTVTLHRVGSGNIYTVWKLFMGRKSTQPE